jgi:Lipocalin-like domain
MRRVLVLTIVALFAAINAAPSSVQGHPPHRGMTDRFVGAWRLLWLEESDADGKIHKADCTGLLVFTSDGHMSVQVMYRNPRSENKSAPVQYAQGGYEASFGRYEINDAHTFTFYVEAALVRTLIGKDLRRVYELSGNQMIVESPDPNEHWRVAWEHY